MFGLAATGPVFWAGIPLLALWGFASPAALGLMSHLVGPSEQGQLQGANASIMGIANLLGPGLFAQTLALSIASGAWHLPGAAFLLAALILALAMVVAWWITARSARRVRRAELATLRWLDARGIAYDGGRNSRNLRLG